jgi:hypothetical protein
MPLPESSPGREPAGDADAPGVAVEHCRLWLNWAATQVDACLADDKPACDRLLDSLADLMGPGRAESATPPADAASCHKMSAIVVAVQSHDRVMQRLAHIAEALRRMHDHLADAGRARSADSWRMLRERQMREFSMAEERELFGRLVAQEDGAGAAGATDRQIYSSLEDTIELFVADSGLGRP